VFFVPVFYVVIQGMIEMISGPPKPIPGEKVHAPGQDDTVPAAH
jgi:hydrophobic/amphiphilic exporter-1 (mainly G- bacteria), HAE1 family